MREEFHLPSPHKKPPERGIYYKVARMPATIERVNPVFSEIASLPPETLADLAWFAVDRDHPDGMRIDYRPGYKRSFSFDDVDFVTKEGKNCGRLNLKGTGHVHLGDNWEGHGLLHPRLKKLNPRAMQQFKNYDGSVGVKGLLSLEDAKIDYEAGERLAELGIRTSRGVAILILKEVYIPGEGNVSVEELRKRVPPVLPPDFIPVIYARAMGADARVGDYTDPNLIKRASGKWLRSMRSKALESSLQRIEAETGRSDMSMSDYVSWFARTLGENIGKLHANGLTHDSLISQRGASFDTFPSNVTLDACIVDLDSVAPANSRKLSADDSRERDIRASKETLFALLQMCAGTDKHLSKKRGKIKNPYLSNADYHTITAIFDVSYKKHYGASTTA